MVVNIIMGNGCSMPENSDDVDVKARAHMLEIPMAVAAKSVGKITLLATNTTVNDIPMPNTAKKISKMKIMESW